MMYIKYSHLYFPESVVLSLYCYCAPRIKAVSTPPEIPRLNQMCSSVTITLKMKKTYG